MHVTLSSFLARTPILFKMYLLVVGSFKHSMATDFLLPLATAFPSRLRLGVSANVRGFFVVHVNLKKPIKI